MHVTCKFCFNNTLVFYEKITWEYSTIRFRQLFLSGMLSKNKFTEEIVPYQYMSTVILLAGALQGPFLSGSAASFKARNEHGCGVFVWVPGLTPGENEHVHVKFDGSWNPGQIFCPNWRPVFRAFFIAISPPKRCREVEQLEQNDDQTIRKCGQMTGVSWIIKFDRYKWRY